MGRNLASRGDAPLQRERCQVTPDLFTDTAPATDAGAPPARRAKRATLPPFVRIIREPWPTYATVTGNLGRIREPDDVARIIRPLAEREEIETFWVLHLDSQSRCRGVEAVTRGLLNSSLVHPREVFRLAIGWGDAGIIVAHNHPSGDPTPSAEDRAATKQLVAAGQLLDIPLYDHVVVAGDRFVSFASAGLL